jgi:hypothetical protein
MNPNILVQNSDPKYVQSAMPSNSLSCNVRHAIRLITMCVLYASFYDGKVSYLRRFVLVANMRIMEVSGVGGQVSSCKALLVRPRSPHMRERDDHMRIQTYHWRAIGVPLS